jgi:hypothetical protein
MPRGPSRKLLALRPLEGEPGLHFSPAACLRCSHRPPALNPFPQSLRLAADRRGISLPAEKTP